MAIQMRRGGYDDFDPAKMLPGEWAVVLEDDEGVSDGRAVYVCFAAGIVKRVAMVEDMAEIVISSNEELVSALTAACNQAAADATAATETANAAEAARVEAENARIAAEAARALAEELRASAESARASAETDRASAESSRATAEADRASAESARADAEAARASAETGRADAETARVSAEEQRKANETARKSAETQRANAEAARAAGETSRATAEAERVASFAIMEQRSKGWLRYYCSEEGVDYDATTRRPIVAEPDESTLYYVPVENPTADNRWVEWQWDSDGDRWEQQGTTEASVSPVTTAQIDDVAADQSVTSSNVLNATGLTYLWAKIKAAFAAVAHTHAASDITSGTLGVARGGTGQTTAAGERNRLGLGNTTGAVPVANGGTGATDAATARSNLGAAASSHTHSAADVTSGTLPVTRGGTGASTAAAAASAIVDGNAIAPASVAATGAISGSSVSDSEGSLADLRESVSPLILAGLVSSGEFSYASSDNTLNFVFKLNDGTQRIIGFTSTQIRFYKRAQGETTLLWSK